MYVKDVFTKTETTSHVVQFPKDGRYISKRWEGKRIRTQQRVCCSATPHISSLLQAYRMSFCDAPNGCFTVSPRFAREAMLWELIDEESAALQD